MAFDTICEALMSEEANTLSMLLGGDDEPIAHSLDAAHELINRRYMAPWWRLQRHLNIGPERVLKEQIGKFKQFVSDVVARRMQRLVPELCPLSVKIINRLIDCICARIQLFNYRSSDMFRV
jgi:hypothetical protein